MWVDCSACDICCDDWVTAKERCNLKARTCGSQHCPVNDFTLLIPGSSSWEDVSPLLLFCCGPGAVFVSMPSLCCLFSQRSLFNVSVTRKFVFRDTSVVKQDLETPVMMWLLEPSVVAVNLLCCLRGLTAVFVIFVMMTG